MGLLLGSNFQGLSVTANRRTTAIKKSEKKKKEKRKKRCQHTAPEDNRGGPRTWCFLSVTSTVTMLPDPWCSTIHFMPCCTNSIFGDPLGCKAFPSAKLFHSPQAGSNSIGRGTKEEKAKGDTGWRTKRAIVFTIIPRKKNVVYI